MATGHSGSTLIDLIIGSHSSAFSLGELWSIPEQIGKATGEQPPICGICADKCEFWNQPDRLDFLYKYYRGVIGQEGITSKVIHRFNSFGGNIYERLFAWSGANMLVDSSKNVWWIRRQLRPNRYWKDIQPYVLFLTRDGRAVSSSHLRKHPNLKMAPVAETWKGTVEKMERFYDSYPAERRIRVSYERLTTEQEPVVQDICEWLGIDYEPDMLEYWKHDHHLVDGNLGTRLAILQYREQQAKNGDRLEYWSEQNKATNQTDAQYYNRQGTAIKMDLRWKRELNEEQLRVFDSIAGEANQLYAYDPDTSEDQVGVQ
jgi:hypothetical protein